MATSTHSTLHLDLRLGKCAFDLDTLSSRIRGISVEDVRVNLDSKPDLISLLEQPQLFAPASCLALRRLLAGPDAPGSVIFSGLGSMSVTAAAAYSDRLLRRSLRPMLAELQAQPFLIVGIPALSWPIGSAIPWQLQR